MAFNRDLRITFKQEGENYHKSRPDYPAELIKDIIEISRINNDSKILDVGCGTGKSMLPLIKKGYPNIEGLDISESMLRVAKSLMPKNKFYNVSFEDFQITKKYNLLLFGTSIHWINKEKVYAKIKDLLDSAGTLAIFWGNHAPDKSPFVKGLSEIYSRNSPDYPSDFKEALAKISERIKGTPGFSDMNVREYFVIEKHTKENLFALINSWSWVIALSELGQKKLFLEIENFLRDYNEPYSLYRTYTLLSAKKI